MTAEPRLPPVPPGLLLLALGSQSCWAQSRKQLHGQLLCYILTSEGQAWVTRRATFSRRLCGEVEGSQVGMGLSPEAQRVPESDPIVEKTAGCCFVLFRTINKAFCCYDDVWAARGPLKVPPGAPGWALSLERSWVKWKANYLHSSS